MTGLLSVHPIFDQAHPLQHKISKIHLYAFLTEKIAPFIIIKIRYVSKKKNI
jgi:hypothetical protein